MKWTFQNDFKCIGILCALLVGCGAPEVITDGKPKTPDSAKRGDLKPRRLRNRPSITLPKIGMLYADRVNTSADGTVVAKGRVYLDVENQTSDTTQGWPRHAYADEARWVPNTMTLVLTGWPTLEKPRLTSVAMHASTTVTLSPGSTRIVGLISTSIGN